MSPIKNKLFSMAAFMAIVGTTACGSGGSSTGNPDTNANQEETSDVGVSLRMLEFGDTVSFEVIATNNTTSVEYTSNEVSISGTSAVPATGTATISAVPYGNYDFTINVYDSSSVLIVTQTFDNSGSGYDVLTNAYALELTINLGDGDGLSGNVSNYTSTISITGELDFPPTPDLDVNDISLVGNFGGTANDVTVTFGDNAVEFLDYEDAGSTTAPLDLCDASSSIDLAYVVTTSSGSSSCVISASNIERDYYTGSTYTASTCGTSADCCQMEVTLEESDLTACTSGTTFGDYDYFNITVTGTDSSGNSATASVNVDINL